MSKSRITVISSDHLLLSCRVITCSCHVERPTGVETSSYMSALKISPLTSFGRNDKMGHFSLHNLKFSLPQTVDVAVFVDRYRLSRAGADFCFRLVGEVYPYPSVIVFHIDEADMMLWCHRMSCAAYLDFDSAVIQTGDNRNMLFVACIYGVRNKFFHLLSAAHYRNL